MNSLSKLVYNNTIIKIRDGEFNALDLFVSVGKSNYEYEYDENVYMNKEDINCYFDEPHQREMVDFINNYYAMLNPIVPVDDFIINNKYNIILGSWFWCLWKPILQKEHIFINKNVLLFLLKGILMDDDIIIGNLINGDCETLPDTDMLKLELKSLLDDNKICYLLLDQLPDETEPIWFSLSARNFKLFILNEINISKYVRNCYLIIEEIYNDYTEIQKTHDQLIADFVLSQQIEMNKFIDLLSIQHKYETKLLRNEIQQKKNIIIKLTQLTLDETPIEKNEWIYVAGNEFYAKNNYFKLGGCDVSLKDRIASYNTNKNIQDQLHCVFKLQVYNYRIIEREFSLYFNRHRVHGNKDLYHMCLREMIYWICHINDSKVANIVNLNAPGARETMYNNALQSSVQLRFIGVEEDNDTIDIVTHPNAITLVKQQLILFNRMEFHINEFKTFLELNNFTVPNRLVLCKMLREHFTEYTCIPTHN